MEGVPIANERTLNYWKQCVLQRFAESAWSMWFTPCAIANVVTGAKRIVQNNSQLKITRDFSFVLISSARSLSLHSFVIQWRVTFIIILFAHSDSNLFVSNTFCSFSFMWRTNVALSLCCHRCSQPLVAVPVAIHPSWSHLLTHLNGFPLYTKNNERRHERASEEEGERERNP